jgi:2-oxoisovalerate dehydrogenase E1 component
LWKLPVLFVCENNQYAMGTPIAVAHAETAIHRKAEAIGVPAQHVDGMSVIRVEAAARCALDSIRNGRRPTVSRV